MQTVSQAIAFVIDLVLRPFAALSPLVAMVIICALTAVVMLIVFKYTSNQARVKIVKSRIKGNFIAIALYKNSLKVLLSSTAKIFSANLRYVALNLKPLLVMLIPMALLLINLDAWYGHRAIAPGESFVINAVVEKGHDLLQEKIQLRVPEGLFLETPPLRDVETGEISWRVKAATAGSYEVAVEVGDQPYEKSIAVGQRLTRLSPIRSKPNFWNALLYPGDSALPANAPLREISLEYPEHDFNLGGWKAHWAYAFFILSLVMAFSLKGVFHVEV